MLTILMRDPGCHTSRPVARDFCFRSVGVQQARSHVRITGGEQPLDSVRTDAEVAIANLASEVHQLRLLHLRSIDQQEVIAARCGLNKLDGIHAYSRSVMPRHSTFSARGMR